MITITGITNVIIGTVAGSREPFGRPYNEDEAKHILDLLVNKKCEGLCLRSVLVDNVHDPKKEKVKLVGIRRIDGSIPGPKKIGYVYTSFVYTEPGEDRGRKVSNKFIKYLLKAGFKMDPIQV